MYADNLIIVLPAILSVSVSLSANFDIKMSCQQKLWVCPERAFSAAYNDVWPDFLAPIMSGSDKKSNVRIS